LKGARGRPWTHSTGWKSRGVTSPGGGTARWRWRERRWPRNDRASRRTELARQARREAQDLRRLDPDGVETVLIDAITRTVDHSSSAHQPESFADADAQLRSKVREQGAAVSLRLNFAALLVARAEWEPGDLGRRWLEEATRADG
jgi:hypothetical protein